MDGQMKMRITQLLIILSTLFLSAAHISLSSKILILKVLAPQ